MPVSSDLEAALARRLFDAEAARRAIPPLTAEYPDLDVQAAYRVQARLIELKVAAGDRVIGRKTGLTSRSKQVQMGVNEGIHGTLLASNVLPEPVVSVGRFIHPRVEPELALLLGEDLAGPAITPAHVMAATRCIFPALEVIDSRYSDFKFTLADVVADNASTAGVIVGPEPAAIGRFDLGLMGVVLEKNGEVVATGAGAAVLGHPLTAVAWLATALRRAGKPLRAGELVLAGAITAAFAVEPGDVITAHFSGLGTLSARVTV